MPFSMHAHRGKRVAGAVVLLLACASASASCRRGSTAGPDDPVLRIGFGIGSSAKDTSLSSLTDLLFAEPLLMRGWDGRTTPRLAESLAWEDGGRRLRLRLTQGVRLHDNTPFTAEVAAGILSRFVATGAGKAQWGFEHVTSVTAPDSQTLLLTLTEPDMFVLSGLADRKMIRPEAPDVGTGPFQLVNRQPVVELRRFNGYYGGASALSGVRIVTYDTTRSVWAALMRDEIDAAQEVSGDSVEFIQRSSNVETYPTLQPFYVSLVFNHRHPVLAKVEVRRALNEAVDKKSIIARTMSGRGREADTPLWPLHWAYTQASARTAHNPESARSRLSRAGFDLPAAGQPGDMRSRFSFTCLVYDEDPQYERIALMVQRQLFDVGVDMQIELVGMDEFLPRAAEGRFDAFLMRANAGRSLDFTYRLWRSAPSTSAVLQNTGYTGADPLLDRLRRSTSDDEIRAAVAALANRFQEDAPAVFIAWVEMTRAVAADFSVGATGTQDPFANIWDWRLADPRR